MKSLLALLALAALGGCAAPGPAVYGGPVAQEAFDPYQWHTVSVEPVWRGAARAPATVTYAPQVEYSPAPVYYSPAPVYYSARPVYVAPRVYAPAPAYYYDPVLPVLTFGLGVVLGNSWHHGGGWHGGGYYGGRR